MAKQLNVDLRFNADTAKAKQAINDLEQSLSRLGHGTMPQNAGIDPVQFEKASAAARELEFHLKNAYNAKTGNLDLSKLASSLNASKTSLKELTTNFSTAGSTGQQAFTALARAIATADQPSLMLNTHLATMVTTLKNVARFQISSSIIHGLIGGIQSAYGFAQDLNKSLNNIRIVTGQSTDQMARFAEQANKTARALSATTLDYTNASLIYYQQGLDDEAVAERTATTIKLANISRQSAEEVSDQMTAIWNNFDDGSQSLEYYADVITALGATTASSSQEIAGGLEKFASVAQTVGLSYEYAASALATIVAATRQSEDTVGTGLRTLFARFEGLKLGETLEDGVDLNKYSAALASIGVNILDANGNLRQMDDILDDMGEKWGTLNQAQKVALAQTVGGVRQYTNLIALMENWEQFQVNVNTANESEGTLQEQADIYAESWEGARKKVQAALESVYNALLDDKFFIKITNGIEHIITGVKSFVDSFGGIQAIITAVLSFALNMVANKIGPAVQKVIQDIQILTGGANKVYQKIQSETTGMINEELSKKTSSGKNLYNEQDSASLKGSIALLGAKTKLGLIEDKLSATEKMRAEVALSGIQKQIEYNEKLGKTLDDLREKEIELTDEYKQELRIAEQKELQGRKDLSEESKKAVNNNIQDAYRKSFSSQNIDINKDSVISLQAARDDALQIGNELRRGLVGAFIDGETEAANFNQVLQSAIDIIGNGDFYKSDMAGSLEEAKGKLEILKSSFGDLIELSPELDASFKQAFNASSSEELDSAVDQIIKNLGTLKEQGIDVEEALEKLKISPKSLQTFKILQKELQQLKKEEEEIDKLLKKEKGNEAALSEAGKKRLKVREQIKEKEKEIKDAIAQTNREAEKFNVSHVITGTEAFAKLGASIGGAATTLRSLKSLFDAFTNVDLSFGEVLIQSLMSLSMLLPGVKTLFEGVSTAVAFIGEKMALSAAATLGYSGAEATAIATTNIGNIIRKAKLSGLAKEEIATLATASSFELLAAEQEKGNAETLLNTTLTGGNTVAHALNKGVKATSIAIQALLSVVSGKVSAATAKETLQTMINTGALTANFAIKAAIAILDGNYVGVIAALAIATAAGTAIIIASTRASKAAAAAREEEAKASSEAAESAREQAKANKELYDSYKEALKTFEETGEGKEELEDLAYQLADAYEIENAQLLIQAKRYEELNNLIKEKQDLEQKALVGKAEDAYDAAWATALDQAETNGTGYWQNTNHGKYRIGFEGGDYFGNGYANLGYQQALKNGTINTDYIDAFLSTGDLVVRSNTNSPAGLMAEYEAVKAIKEEIVAIAKEEGIDPSTIKEYREMNGYLSDNADWYESLVKSRELLTDSNLDEIFLSSDPVTNIEDYNKQFQIFVDRLTQLNKEKSLGLKDDEINDIAKSYAEAAYDNNIVAGSQAAKFVTGTITGTGEDFATWFDSLTAEEQTMVLTLIPNAGGKISIDDLISGLADAESLLSVQKWEKQSAIISDLITQAKDKKTTDKDWENAFNNSSNSDIWENMGIDSAFDLLTLTDDEKIAALTEYQTQIDALAAQERQSIIAEQTALIEQLTPLQENASQVYQDALTAYEAAANQSLTYTNDNNTSATISADQLAQIKSIYDEYGFSETGIAKLDEIASSINSDFDYMDMFNVIDQYNEIVGEQTEAAAAAVDEAKAALDSYNNQITNAQNKIDEATVEPIDPELINFQNLKERINNEDLKYDDIKEYADYLRDAAKAGDGVAKSLEEQTQESLELATKLSLMQRAIDKLHDNLNNYTDVLKGTNKGTKEYASQLSGLQDIMKDLAGTADFDPDGSIFDGKFFEQNAELFQKAANGDREAIWELQKAAAEQIVLNIDNQGAVQEFQTIIEGLEALIPEDLEIGTSISEIEGADAYMASLQALLDAGQITANEVNAALGAIGFEPEIIYVPISAVSESTIGVNGGQDVDINGQSVHVSSEAYETAKSQGVATIPVISSSATRSTARAGGGGLKLPSGSSGGGGGGGSKTKEKKNPTDERDRYHTITEKIDDATNAYNELSKAEDRAFGKERIKAMEGITDNLKLQIELQKRYIDEIKNYLVGDREAVEALGAQFDINGVITNYDNLIAELVNKYNEGVDLFNAGDIDEDEFKEQYEEPFNNAREAIDQYVETINLLQSEELNLIDLQNDLADQLREIAAYKLELHIDIDEDELKYLDFLLEILGENAEDAVDRLDLLGQQFNTNRDEIAAYTTAIQDLLRLRGFTDEDVAAFIRGELTAGDLEERGFTTDDIDKLREYRDAIQDNTTAMNDLAKEIEESFLNTLDDLNEKVDDAEERFEHFAAMLEHFHNVVDIVGQDALGMSAETMKLLAKAAKENAIEMVKAAKTQLDSLNAVRAQAQAQLDAALEAQKNASTAEEKLRADEAVRYWSDTISEVTNRVEQAEEDLADALENALEGIQEMYTTMIEQATKEFERSVTGAAGSLEQLQKNFDRQKETQDLYIPTYEKIYELTKLTRDINNSIDDTDNLWSKQELAKLQDEINQKMEDGVELTEHDVEELRKRYELKLAEAALEEAQDAKRTVRMSRDNEGNWSYVYTADENDVAAAEQNYEDKLYEYQQMNYQYIQDLQANIIQAQQDMVDAINDLDATSFASQEEYLAEVQRIRDAAMAKISQYRDQLAQTLDQQGILYEEDWKRYNELTGYRMARDDQWVDNWNETILAQETGFETLEGMFDQITGAIGGPDEPGTYVGDITDAYAEMQASNERALNAAGTSMQTYEQDVTSAVNDINGEIEDTQNEVEEFSEKMTDMMKEVTDFIGTWKEEYGNAVKDLTKFNEDLYASCQKLITALQQTFNLNAEFEASQSAGSTEGGPSGSTRGGNNTGNGNTGNGNTGTEIGPEPGGQQHNYSESVDNKKFYSNDVAHWNLKEYKDNGVTYKTEKVGVESHDWRELANHSGYVCEKCHRRSNFSTINLKSGGYTGTWSMASGRSGLYTGSWNGPDLEENGRLAFLHQKELVLNASDTENFLSAVDMVRQISQTIDLQAASRSNGLNFLLPDVLGRGPDTLDQNVHIEAHFPNVTSHSEIEEAFTNLVGKASQFANR